MVPPISRLPALQWLERMGPLSKRVSWTSLVRSSSALATCCRLTVLGVRQGPQSHIEVPFRHFPRPEGVFAPLVTATVAATRSS